MSKTIAQNFVDWENDAFGFGYGTGEAYTIPALRMFLERCTGAMGHSYDYRTLERDLGPVPTWLLINLLGRTDIIEYGTSPRFGWLTCRGQALQKFMLSQTTNHLVHYVCEGPEEYTHCYPEGCNCGPRGYEEHRVCVNPFWQDEAASAYLKT